MVKFGTNIGAQTHQTSMPKQVPTNSIAIHSKKHCFLKVYSKKGIETQWTNQSILFGEKTKIDQHRPIERQMLEKELQGNETL